MVNAHEFVVSATADDGSPTILAFDGDDVTFYRRREDVVDVVTHKIQGAVLTEHRKLVEAGLLTTGFTLKHPVFPGSGELKVETYHFEQGDDAAFRKHVRRILRPHHAQLGDKRPVQRRSHGR